MHFKPILACIVLVLSSPAAVQARSLYSSGYPRGLYFSVSLGYNNLHNHSFAAAEAGRATSTSPAGVIETTLSDGLAAAFNFGYDFGLV